MWNEHIHKFLENLGFKRSIKDYGLYILSEGKIIMWLAFYIDDSFLISNDSNSTNKIKAALSKKYEMSDLEDLYSRLNMQITRKTNEYILKLNQTKYIGKILKEFNMDNAKPMATPLKTDCYSLYIQDVITKEEEEFMKNIPYKSATGSLMHLVMTSRPDIAQAVSAVSQYTTNPRTKHWSAVKRIFCYFRGTMQEGLRFKGNGNIEIIGYYDLVINKPKYQEVDMSSR